MKNKEKDTQTNRQIYWQTNMQTERQDNIQKVCYITLILLHKKRHHVKDAPKIMLEYVFNFSNDHLKVMPLTMWVVEDGQMSS